MRQPHLSIVETKRLARIIGPFYETGEFPFSSRRFCKSEEMVVCTPDKQIILARRSIEFPRAV